MADDEDEQDTDDEEEDEKSGQLSCLFMFSCAAFIVIAGATFMATVFVRDIRDDYRKVHKTELEKTP